jgi:predicted enzyme related to lactoylglutathione lyase
MARLPGGAVGAISSQGESAPAEPTWNTYVAVESADEAADRVREAGGVVLTDPFDVMDAGRMAVCADPEGARFCIWQAGSRRGADVVNEPGSVNFNILHTRDIGGAQSFYGAVFGWELLDAGGAPMWALPAYGDLLERRNPGTRENMASMGAPERFEEVVAGITVIADDQADEPAHWGVVFATGDADATAARAAELGGRVVLPPMDAPWVRTTVIEDAQGATFSANQFVAENKDVAPAG